MKKIVRNSFLVALCLYSFASKAQIITTIAGTGAAAYGGDGGPATAAILYAPSNVALDNMGNLYIADEYNHRVRKIDITGIISTIAGTGTSGYTADGIAATASGLNDPYGIAFDVAGNIYISDNNQSRIRKVDAAGIITTIAGTGTSGYTGDGIPATAAELSGPDGLKVDGAGNIFFADVRNNSVRRIDAASGIITTFAGTETLGFAGDGLAATTAEFHYPSDVAIDAIGNVFIADLQNRRMRKVDTAGIINTIAGTGGSGSVGDGSTATTATFMYPSNIEIDSIGNVFIADGNANKVRKINRTGIINTIAGTGTAGHTGDGSPATAAELNGPGGIAIDKYGSLYIAEGAGNYIRKISTGNSLPAFTRGRNLALTVCTNDTASIDSLLPITDADAGQTETWTLTVAPRHGTANAGFTATSTGSTVTTTGLWYAPTAGYTGNDTFSVRVDDGYSVYTTTIYASIPNCSLSATNNLQPTEAVKVFPNPNEGSFTIQPSATGIATKIVITNAVGSVVKEMSITKATDIKLNVPAGDYTVSATANGNKQVVKVVVE